MSAFINPPVQLGFPSDAREVALLGRANSTLPGGGEEGGILLKRSLLSLPSGLESLGQLRGLPPGQGSANWNCCRNQAGIYSHTRHSWQGFGQDTLHRGIPTALSPAELLQPLSSQHSRGSLSSLPAQEHVLEQHPNLLLLSTWISSSFLNPWWDRGAGQGAEEN